MTAEELGLHREAAAAHEVLAELWRRRWRVAERCAAAPTPYNRRAVRAIDDRMIDAEAHLEEIEVALRGLWHGGVRAARR